MVELSDTLISGAFEDCYLDCIRSRSRENIFFTGKHPVSSTRKPIYAVLKTRMYLCILGIWSFCVLLQKKERLLQLIDLGQSNWIIMWLHRCWSVLFEGLRTRNTTSSIVKQTAAGWNEAIFAKENWAVEHHYYYLIRFIVHTEP